MHEQGQAFGVCLANKVSQPVWGAVGNVWTIEMQLTQSFSG